MENGECHECRRKQHKKASGELEAPPGFAEDQGKAGKAKDRKLKNRSDWSKDYVKRKRRGTKVQSFDI